MLPSLLTAPALGREVRPSPVASRVLAMKLCYLLVLTLTLLVTKVVADHHDATIATDHFALVADLLHAWFDLHDSFSLLQLLLVPISDTSSSEVVRTQFHDHTILRKDADVVLSHLPGDVCQHNMSIGQLHAEHRVR
jgi:hypothetical protein